MPGQKGFGTLAHLLVVRELQAFHPGIKKYRIKSDREFVSPEREAQLQAMGLERVFSKNGLSFETYTRKSREYGRRRFGFLVE